MSVTITLHLWWLLAYLAVGVLLWLPLEWVAWRSVRSGVPFWRALPRALRRNPYVPMVTVVAWPLAVWEVVR